MFKAFARALRLATEIDPRRAGAIPSSKGILEQAGCEVLFIDAHAEDLTLEQTTQKLQNFGPAFIGYTITTYLFFQTLDWIKAIKEIVDVPTIVGGVHLSIYPRETLTHSAIDYADVISCSDCGL